MKRQMSLFHRTALIVAAGLVLLQLAAVAVLMTNLVFPLARRSADDLAALLVLVSDLWADESLAGRQRLVDTLRQEYSIALQAAAEPLVDQRSLSPYRGFLRAALAARLPAERPPALRKGDGEYFLVELERRGHRLRFALSKVALAPQPLRASVWIAFAALLSTLLVAWLLARRINAPVARMAEVVRRIARDDRPPQLPETGEAEFAELARLFNDMARQLQARRDNQSALLAGVSHDLRSPLARLKMAVGVLSEQTDSPLVVSMERDIEHMDALIGAQLELARAHERELVCPVDLDEMLGELADAAEAGAPGRVRLLANGVGRMIPTAPTALHRCVSNLLENGLRHSGGSPVEVARRHSSRAVMIGVRDRGPGIAPVQLEAVFQPFYRVGAGAQRSEGSGLGLAITRQLAETQGWGLRLCNRKGGGLAAWLRIPLP